MIIDEFPKITISSTKLRILAKSFLEKIENSETRRVRYYALDVFIDFHRTRKSFEFQVEDIKKYIYFLEKRKEKKGHTIKNYLVALRLFFQFLVTQGVLIKNPVNRINYSYNKPKTKYEIITGLNKIFDPDENIITNRNKVILAVLLYTNLDLEIISTIKSNELKLIGRNYHILDNKISVKANKIIHNYLSKINDLEINYLFINFGKRNNLKPISPRNIKEICKVELEKLGIKSNYLKLIKNTRIFLDYKYHRSAKKLREKYHLSSATLNKYVAYFDEIFENSKGNSF